MAVARVYNYNYIMFNSLYIYIVSIMFHNIHNIRYILHSLQGTLIGTNPNRQIWVSTGLRTLLNAEKKK